MRLGAEARAARARSRRWPARPACSREYSAAAHAQGRAIVQQREQQLLPRRLVERRIIGLDARDRAAARPSRPRAGRSSGADRPSPDGSRRPRTARISGCSRVRDQRRAVMRRSESSIMRRSARNSLGAGIGVLRRYGVAQRLRAGEVVRASRRAARRCRSARGGRARRRDARWRRASASASACMSPA